MKQGLTMFYSYRLWRRMLNEVKAGTITPVDISLIYDRILKLQR